jgi:hypothetical protein
MLRNINRVEGGRICGPPSMDWPGRAAQVLRNLNASSVRKRILGTPYIGLTGAQILAQTAAGEFGAGAMYNDGLVPDRRYRMIVLASTFAANALRLEEDGSGYFAGAGAALYMLQEDGAPVSAPPAQRTLTAGYADAGGGLPGLWGGGAPGGYPSGPDSQLTLDEYRKRFGSGPPQAAPALPEAHPLRAAAVDDESITVLMWAIAAVLRVSSHVPPT